MVWHFGLSCRTAGLIDLQIPLAVVAFLQHWFSIWSHQHFKLLGTHSPPYQDLRNIGLEEHLKTSIDNTRQPPLLASGAGRGAIIRHVTFDLLFPASHTSGDLAAYVDRLTIAKRLPKSLRGPRTTGGFHCNRAGSLDLMGRLIFGK